MGEIALKKILAVFLAIAIGIFSILPPVAQAAGENLSLVVEYEFNTTFKIYRIGGRDPSGNHYLDPPFDQFPIDFEKLNDDSLRDLATTLSAFIRSKGGELAPLKTGETRGGSLRFENLDAGLYLVIGDPHQEVREGETYTYTPSPSIHYLDSDTRIEVKYEYTKEGEGLSIRVVKVWEDGDDPDRPKTINLALYKSGQEEALDRVSLSGESGWTHTWTNLEAGSYQVLEEDVPEGYRVRISSDQDSKAKGSGSKTTLFEIVNSKEPSPGPKKTPGKTPRKTPPGQKTPSSIPQTGQVWTPAFVFFGLAICFFLIGLAKDRQKNGDKI